MLDALRIMTKYPTDRLRAGRPRGSSRFDPESAKAFGLTIRKFRLEKGVSQEDIAEVIGIDRSYMGRLERGEASPSLSLILKIAKSLNISSSLLLGETEKVLYEKSS